jgi:hypothetical protein
MEDGERGGRARLGREAADMRSASRYISYLKKTESQLVGTAMWRRALYLCRVKRLICIIDPPPRRKRWGKPIEPVEAR